MSGVVKAPGNVTVTFDATDITQYLDQAELQAAVAELETTALNSVAQEYIPGLPNWQGNLKVAKWDSVIDGIIAANVLTPAKKNCIWTFKDATAVTVTYTWTNNAFFTGYNISGAIGTKIESSPSLRLSGNPTRA